MKRAAKGTVVVGLLVLATLLWTVGGVAIWANRQMLDTQNWVNTSDRLLRNDEIRTALSTALLDRLYQSKPLETALREQLPANLQPLVGPAAAALRQVANERTPQILGSTAALTAWEVANRNAHKVFLKILNGDVAAGGEVNLDVKALLSQVAAGAGVPAGVVDKLPPQYQQIQILKSDQIKTAQDGTQTLKALPWILLPLALLLFGGAVFLSADRRRGAVWAGGCMIFAGVAILVVRMFGSDQVVNALAQAPNVRPAAKATLAIGTSLLVDVAWGSILIGVLIVSGGWLLGHGRVATWLRNVSAPALRDHPAGTRVALGFLLLLLVLWGPVPWTRNVWAVLVFAILAFIWLERVRHVTVAEFPDVPSGELWRRVRTAMPGRRRPEAAATSDDPLDRLEHLVDLRTRGVLDEAEYERQKAALLAATP